MKKIWFAALLVMTFQTLGRAEFVRGSQTATIFGGQGGTNTQYDYNPGDERSVTGSGGSFGAQYFYYVKGTPAIALGADLATSLNGNRRSGSLLYGVETTARVKSLVGLVMARLSFPHGMYRPYLFTGIGGHDSTQQLSGQPQPGSTWLGGGTESRILVDEHKTSVAVGYGIGMDVFPSETYFFGLELRETWLGGLDTDDTPALRSAGYTVDNKRGVAQGNLFFRAGMKF